MTTLKKDEKKASKKPKKTTTMTIGQKASGRNAKTVKPQRLEEPVKTVSSIESGRTYYAETPEFLEVTDEDRRYHKIVVNVEENDSDDLTAVSRKSSGKFERKASFRQKIGSLIRGSAELPAAINRGLQPIRRSLSFSKDLNRLHEPSKPIRTTSVQWYNSLVSLAEDECLDELDTTPKRNIEDHHPPKAQVTRTQSLIDTNFVRSARRRVNELLSKTAPYGRHSDHYDSTIDLSNPPCEASSLPALASADDLNNELKSLREREQQVRSEWRNLKVAVRNLSQLHVGQSAGKHHSVRSRSLTQLDALGNSMLDTGEHHLGSGTSQQQPHQLHQHYQPQQLQHHPQNVEASPRFLVPNATSIESTHQNRTKHKLSRSQVSSSEYFSISFDLSEDPGSLDRDEFLPATKGTCLAEALNATCERRGIDLSRIEVYDGFSTPLPILTTDTSSLGGKHLRITVKDAEKTNSRPTVQRVSTQSVSLRKTGGSYRSRSGRFFSVSTEDSSVDSEVSSSTTITSGRSSAGAAGHKTSKQRWSGFFTNTKGNKLDLLTAQLDEYNKHGVPRLADIQMPYELTLNEDALYSLEEDWRDIVHNSDQLSEKQQQQQTALWELAQTEVAYIRTLKVVTDLFMACLCSLQASNILIEVDRSKLFSNIPEIYSANRYFWTEYVLMMVNASRSTGQLLDSGHLLQGFETFEQTFAPYTRYCAEQSRCQQYCRDRLNDNQLFTVYLVWCETQKDCNRLKLLDILVKPMQRLTKYSLLLKAVQKNTENEEQRAELIHMIKSVDDFVASVNAALKRNEETARLATAASRIENYDVVESRDEELEKLIKIHSTFDITTAPMPGCPKDTLRVLLREGDLKLRDAASSKTEVHILLLTDMLLICKPSTKKTSSSGLAGSVGGGLKIIRQPYVIDRIRIHELKEPSSLGLIYLNEYGAASAALVLSAGESKLAKSWMESLRKAQQQFALMKLPPLGNTLNLNLGTVSRQPSTFLGDVDLEGDECETILKTPRGSSRASRVSSLAHSHSGSIEMEGVSPGSSNFVPSYNPSRNVSVETNEPPRASSVSSEEGGEPSGHNHRPMQISPNKFDNRRYLLSKSPTPNTLSVQVPAYSSLGQSLPNLTLATSPQTSTVSPTPPNSLLIVPQITKSKDTLLSPGHRGISYPPPSPPRGALRRAVAIPQSRNPPLVKTRHISTSVTQTIQPTMNLDTEAIEERRKRLEPSHRMPSTSSIAEEKVNSFDL
ncbi:PREDICTED: pleckstrin homology domain-containing family G member 5 [Dufourea novaeangliae]|uniref:pleckstrin homology domain-containing family G member 5 n=1 Tax=Dufourea novaeangliae TaxID=178035 RepID=UPI000767CB8F|nr:PREDICTED: pleckstrin homology domain-containing family G member 5 [Dufourea novaeangliae]